MVSASNPVPPRADSAQTRVTRVRAGALAPAWQDDRVAEETPVALEYNGISHDTMLATPADREDFAQGFSLTEGIVDHASDVRGIDLRPQCDGIVIELEIASSCAMRLRERRRAMAGRTGCGLCGVETLPEVLRDVPAVQADTAIPVNAVLQAMRGLRARQPLHDLTGATHAAGWARSDGTLELVREDVGRHNALDKLIGALARAGVDAGTGMILVSSRASFEMVQKAASAGAGMLAAVSAPTALAIRTAQRANLTLLGFVRQADATLYTHPGRITS